MDCLDHEVKEKIWDILRVCKPMETLCRCHSPFTVAMRLGSDILMSNTSVLVTGKVIPWNLTGSSFFGSSVHCFDCQCERFTECDIRFPLWQWDLTIAEADEVLLVGALWDGDTITLMHDQSGAFPLPDGRNRMNHRVVEGHHINCYEMFAGGFGGWGHAITGMRDVGIPISSTYALDFDEHCAEAFCKSHQFTFVSSCPKHCCDEINRYESQGVASKVVMNTSIDQFWWLSILAMDRVDVWCVSAPCPPWSHADLAPGLAKMDGRHLVLSIALMALYRPKTLVLENVSTLLQHKHWKVIREAFMWAGYHIKWVQSLDLLDVLPQKRERMILVAIDVHNPKVGLHICQTWPKVLSPSLRSHDILIQLDDIWLKQSHVSTSELKLYMDPHNLPKDAKVMNPAKRSKKDMIKYRLRSVDDFFACILTSYGQPLQLHEKLIQRGGIYGSLVLDGGVPRKLTLPEIAMLFGILGRTWLPLDFQLATKFLGNAISIPHALIGLLNAVQFIYPSIGAEMSTQEIFARIMSKRIKAEDIQWNFEADGVWISQNENQTAVGLAPTQPMCRTANLVVHSPLNTYVVKCEHGVSILETLRILNGPSIPAFVELRFGDAKEVHVPLTDDIKMGAKDIHVYTNVESRLIIDDALFARCGQRYLVVLTPDMPLILHRHSFHQYQEVLQTLSMLWPEHVNEWRLGGMTRSLPDLQEHCPGAMWITKKIGQTFELPIDQWMNMVHVQSDAFVWHGNHHELQVLFNTWLDGGIVDILACVGWHFTMTMHSTSEECDRKLYLSPRPGTLHATYETVRSMIITRLFLMIMPNEELQHEGGVQVKIKIWNSWAWKGKVEPSMKIGDLIHLWFQASLLAKFPMEMRVVCFGKRANPDLEIRQYCVDNDTPIPLHLILSLHGGGSGSVPHNIPISDTASEYETWINPIALQDMDMQSAISIMIRQFYQIPFDSRDFEMNIISGIKMYEEVHQFVVVGPMTHVIRFMRFFKESGIERMLDSIGWQVVLQFREYTSPAKVAALICPIAGKQTSSITLASSFMRSILTILALPEQKGLHLDLVKVSIKLWDDWVYEQMLSKYTPCHVFTDAWDEVSDFMGKDGNMRMICRGRRLNPDYALHHYARTNHDGDMHVRIHFVLGLHGGAGGPKSNTEAFVKAKNGMATMLLGLGCDLKEVSMFVERIVSAAGPSAVEQITKMSESHAQIHALQSLSKTLNMTMPQIDKSSHQRGKIVQKTLAKKTPIEVVINPSDYQVTEGFFYNQDDTPCLQKESIRGSSTGFTLMDGESAMPWISSSQPMSADELGVVIIGSCPSKVTSGCNRVKVPMYNKQGQPLIMDCCLHQLGSKDIKIKTPKQVDVKVSDSRVMAVTIFQDEVEQRVWEQMTKSPIKTIFEILNGLDLQINLPSPPWGRSWRNPKGPCHPEAAESFQCHMRVLAGDFREMLCVSGQAGLYTTPKDEKHHVDTSFGIIWIDIAIDTLKVQASAYPSNRGLVKVVKGRSAKISRGVRVDSSDYAEAHKHFKPSQDVPDMIAANYIAKLTPTPVGANAADVRNWLKQMKWPAKPLKPMGKDTWILGFSSQIDDQFVKWGESLMLLTWIPNKQQMRNQPIIAGDKPKPIPQKQWDGVTHDKGDPWEQYMANTRGNAKPEANISLQSSRAPGNTGVSQRVTDGPVEERFKKQDAQIDALRQSMQQMQDRVDQSAKDQKTFGEQVKQEFGQIRGEFTKALAHTTETFEKTLDTSLRRQDTQLHQAFTELKALFQSTPVPAKKAKTQKPGDKVEDIEVDDS